MVNQKEDYRERPGNRKKGKGFISFRRRRLLVFLFRYD
jgi:hypothetical protein